MQCVNISKGKPCVDGHLTWQDGEGWKCSDNCNQCSCNDGQITSTLKNCKTIINWDKLAIWKFKFSLKIFDSVYQTKFTYEQVKRYIRA